MSCSELMLKHDDTLHFYWYDLRPALPSHYLVRTKLLVQKPCVLSRSIVLDYVNTHTDVGLSRDDEGLSRDDVDVVGWVVVSCSRH